MGAKRESSGGDFLRSLVVIGILAGLWFYFAHDKSPDPTRASPNPTLHDPPQVPPPRVPLSAKESAQSPEAREPAYPSAQAPLPGSGIDFGRPSKGPVYSPETGKLVYPGAQPPPSISGLDFGNSPPPEQDQRPEQNQRDPRPTNARKPVHVKGYYRKDGTYVRPHTRRAPNR